MFSNDYRRHKSYMCLFTHAYHHYIFFSIIVLHLVPVADLEQVQGLLEHLFET